MTKKQTIRDKNELEKKSKREENEFFINIDLSDFPSMMEMYDDRAKKIALGLITKIVWYILKKEGKLITLKVQEQNLKEIGENIEDINDKKHKGKAIKEYVPTRDLINLPTNDEVFNKKNDYSKESENNNINYEIDPRIDDIIDKLQILLFGNNETNIKKQPFLEVFYDEYGEVSNAQEEFIEFCKKIIREEIVVYRGLDSKVKNKIINNCIVDNEINEANKDILNSLIKKQEMREKTSMRSKLIKFLLENSQKINDVILKQLLEDNFMNKTEEIKKALIVFYMDYRNLIESDSINSPSDMKIFTLLKNYFGKTEIKQLEQEIQNISPKQKQEWIEKQLDYLSFWQNFYNIYEKDINSTNYNKESNKIKAKNESRFKENIIQKMKDIIINYSISNDIPIMKEEIEIILSILRRLMLKTGGNLTKLEITEVSNKIHDYNPCEKYKDYIKYSVFGFIEKQKEIEDHISKCDNCKLYKKYISESKTAREKRNKNILKIVKTNPYIVEQELTEEQYIDINYLKEQFRENPCETNFYYLVSAYIKNGNKKHAEKLLNEGFGLYKENVFMKETLIYLKEKN